MNKKAKKIIIASVILIFVGLLCWGFYEFAKMFEEHNRATQLPAPGTPARERLDKTWARISEEGEQIDKAMKLEKEGKYDLAILEYKKALEMGMSESEARYGLSICYEKTGQYDLAIEQIDWFISKKPGEDAMKNLIQRKAHIQKLLQEQKQ